jgi:hypothetical protein
LVGFPVKNFAVFGKVFGTFPTSLWQFLDKSLAGFPKRSLAELPDMNEGEFADMTLAEFPDLTLSGFSTRLIDTQCHLVKID